jgi:hypothetical protein
MDLREAVCCVCGRSVAMTPTQADEYARRPECFTRLCHETCLPYADVRSNERIVREGPPKVLA